MVDLRGIMRVGTVLVAASTLVSSTLVFSPPAAAADEEDAEALEEAIEREEAKAERVALRRQLEMRRHLAREISFEFNGTPLPEAVQFLQTLTKVNIVVSQEVIDREGGPPKVTIKLQNVTVEEALRILARQQGLDADFEHAAVILEPREGRQGDGDRGAGRGEITVRDGRVGLRIGVPVDEIEEEVRRALLRRALRGVVRIGEPGPEEDEKAAWVMRWGGKMLDNLLKVRKRIEVELAAARKREDRPMAKELENRLQMLLDKERVVRLKMAAGDGDHKAKRNGPEGQEGPRGEEEF